MSELNEVECGQLCQSTIQCLYSVTGSLSNFPGLIKKIIKNEAWKRRLNKGNVIELSSFRELITEKPIRGWGEDPKKVEAVIKDDPECLALFRDAMKMKPGPKIDSCNNITTTKPQTTGTSRAYSLDLVQRKCDPEVVAKVMSGEMSPNAALIKAGIRKVPTPLETCVKAFAKCEDKSEAIATILKQVPVIATDTGTAVKQVMAIWERSDEVSRKAMYVWISDQFKS